MPIYKSPLSNENIFHSKSEIDIGRIVIEHPESDIKKVKNIVSFPKFEHIIKYFCRSFFQIISVLILKRKKDISYIAFIPTGDMGDLIRFKNIMMGLIAMSPGVIIDVFWNKRKIYPIFKDIKNIRFYIHTSFINILKSHYDIIYKASVYCGTKAIFIRKGKELSDKVSNNLKEYKDKFQTAKHIMSLHRITAGIEIIEDSSFSLSYEKQSLDKFSISKNMKYITFQQGATDKGIINHTRCWSNENWNKLLLILRDKIDKRIFIVRVGLKNCGDIITISNFIDTVGKTSFNELCSILKNSSLHIDIDGGCVHISRAIGTKSLVLFGPTSPEFIGYDENINIISSA
ncbi:MAG: hypothetical protein LBT79_05140, partial [Elusimicrobiota bacterium]|nr:hypothetical protein [Elusimicrobiota bacterium]